MSFCVSVGYTSLNILPLISWYPSVTEVNVTSLSSAILDPILLNLVTHSLAPAHSSLARTDDTSFHKPSHVTLSQSELPYLWGLHYMS